MPSRAALVGRLVPVQALAAHEREQMFALMCSYFQGVEWDAFQRDLHEKEQVALVAEQASGQIRGFSSLMQLRVCVDEHPACLLFSGDTIMERAYWGDMTLHRLLGQHFFAVAAASPAPTYWFLICSGYKTYRMLPVFFRTFYPTCEHPTPPAIQCLLDTAARQKFGPRYDAERGIIRLRHATPLQPGVADITGHRLQDPHIAFFARANPGHATGEELACLARISADNLTAAGRRVLGR